MTDLSRRDFLKAGAAAAATTAVPAKLGAAHGKRNVLFIAVDDLNHSLGCYGEPVHTPNLDALAARGVRFDASYCQYPLCGPSRSSLMTGLAPDTTKVLNNGPQFRERMPDAVPIPELFRKNGYYVARVGKVYHANDPMDEGQDGADDPASWEYKYNDAGVDRTDELKKVEIYSAPEKTNIGDAIGLYKSPAPDRQITDSIGADEIIRLLKENKDKPFFIAYGLYRPHVPWVVPQAYFDMYPLESIHPQPFDPAEMKQAPEAAYYVKTPNYGMNEDHCKRAIQGYYASTTFIDVQIGRVLAALKELGLEDDTVVVFWADHGWQLGQHGQWQKQTLFEWAARVPFMMAGPGVKNGGVVKRTTEHLDIYPTLVELCGLQNAPKLQGASLTPLLKDPAGSTWNKPAVTQVHRGSKPPVDGYSIRTERYRYTMWEGGETGEELYDYQTDPREVKNLAADAGMKSVKEALHKQLLGIRASRTA